MNKHLPHITFHLNKKLDCKMAKEFIQPVKKAGFSFVNEILMVHPAIKKFISLPNDIRNKMIADYIDDFYNKNQRQLCNSKQYFQKKWDESEKTFFELAKEIFEDLPWPSGNYKGFVSIFPIGPRFIKSKEFQTYWLWRNNLISQVIHELLHFQFYNLAEIIKNKINISEDEIWHLSEIFNDIVQSEAKFVKLQKLKPKVGYPEHKILHQKYKKIWLSTGSAREFIIKSSLEICRANRNQ